METIDNKMEFEGLVNFYMERLEVHYLKKIEEADNERYAKAVFRRVLFEKNQKIPQNSFFFDRVARTFLHHYRMDTVNALILTFDEMYDIKNLAELQLAVSVDSKSKNEDNPFSDQDKKEYDLILLEYHEIYDLLAYFLATRKLCDKYAEDKEVQALSIEAPLTDKSKIKSNRTQPYSETFTVNQQLLALHFILIQSGSVPRSDHDLSDFTRMAHLLSNKPITTVNNSGLHDNAKVLFKKIDGKNHLKNLKRILPFFQGCRLTTAATTIKNEIEQIEKNQDS